MRRVVLLFLGIVVCACSNLYAQAGKVTGRVLDETGQGLAGAGIAVTGTNTGTVTDENGAFAIEVPENKSSLVVQSIGYETQTVAVTENSLIVRMRLAVRSLNETVVTALAISREKKQLGYTVNQVKSDDIRRSGEGNIIQALAAKAPGVNVISSSGTPGASSKIILRGSSNFTGENQPLIVIDGVPIDNTTSQPLAGDYPYNQDLSGVNESNRALDINPEDVESISILKGPAAAALYGERGGNGAIMITTKKGRYSKTKGLGITFSSSVEWSKVNKLPDFQQTFAQGNKGVYSAYDPGPDGLVGTGDDIPGTPNSWGPRIDTAGLKTYDNNKAFFQTGVAYNNDLSITGGNEKSAFRLSISNMNNKGIIPNSKLERTTVRLSAEHAPVANITFGGSVNYSHTEGRRVQNGSTLGGTMLTLLRTPASFDITDWYDADRHQQKPYYAIYDNPLFTVNRNPYTDRTDRMIGNMYANIQLVNHFSLSYKLGMDVYNTRNTQIFDLSSFGNDANDGKGQVNRSNTNYNQYYSDLILKYDNQLSSKLQLFAFAGYNYWYEETKFDFSRGRNIQIPDLYNLGNTSELYSSNSDVYRRTQALFAEATLGYDRQLYLTLTGRNEWSTTLGKAAPSFFYPKADLSWVFTEKMPSNDVIGFGKVRAASATAATSPNPYTNRNYYVQPFITDGNTNGNGFPYLGQTGYSANNVNYPGNLKPQVVTSREIGLETRLIKNRVGFEITYYNQLSKDVLLNRPVGPSTGYQYEYVNAGRISNKGIEVSLSGSIIKKHALNWDMIVNWSKNKSEVLELAQGVKELSIESGFSDVGSYAIVGQPYGVFYGTAWQRDANGKILVNENGQALVDPVTKRIGNPNPDWLMNINSVFTFKNLTFSFLWDIRKGGDVWNGTYARLTRYGRTAETEDRNRTFVIDGVYAPGTPNAGQQNITPVSALYYFQTYKGDLGNYAAESAIQDGSWIRLRQIGLSYRFNFPHSAEKGIKYVEVGVNARNLLLFTRYKGVDPETSLTGAGSNISGYDYFNNPGAKSYSLNVRLGL